MLILAIDTALDACAVAVLDTATGKTIAQASEPMARGHAEALMPMIAVIMKQSRVPYAELDRIVVTNGPGSFTGLRVGLSAARGIALAAGKPAVGVTTLTAYAAPLVAENAGHPVFAAIDARHDHVYYQVVAGDGSSLLLPRLGPIDEALGAARFGAPRLVGNAAAILAQRWPADAPQPLQVDPKPAPEVAWVGWLGAAATPERAPPRPFYLRAPDAKPQRDALQRAASPAA